MKKTVLLIMLVFMCFSSALTASATEDIKGEISEKLFSSIDDEVSDLLKDFGITSLDYDSIYNISLKSIFSYYKDSIADSLRGSIKLFSKVFAVIIIGGTVSMIIDEQKNKEVLPVLLIPVTTIILVDEINLCISSALSLLKLNGSFMLAFVPVFAIAVAVAGNPAAALTYNSLVLGLAEVISAVINFGLVDIIGCFFCLSIGFSVNRSINLSRLISAVNRFVSFSLGLCSSVFASVLSVKGIFSAATDSVASKSIRFAIGSLIPIIGSSISDAYSTLLGSFGILKNSVAIIGIIAVILINFPVVTEIMFFNISLNLLSFIGEIFGCSEVSDVLKAFSCGVKFIGVLVIFEAFILIITTAIMLSFRGG